MMRTLLIGGLACAALVAGANDARAQSRAKDAPASYPSRPVRVIVPYSPGGSSDAVARIVGQKLTDVIGGQIPAAFPTFPGAFPHVRAGRLRALALTTTKRSSILPEVPTFEESGVPGMVVNNWFGVFGPAKLQKDLVARLHKIVLDAVNAPDVRARFTALSLDITATTPQEFEAHLKSELEKWGKVVKAAGIKPE